MKYVPGQQSYTITIDGLDETIYYELRVFVVDARGETLAQTEQFKVICVCLVKSKALYAQVGSAATRSCTGAAGIPTGVEMEYVGDTSVTVRWIRPKCDDSLGPIEAYEYAIWDERQQTADEAHTALVRVTRVTVNDLRPHTRYAFRVRSRSAAGASDWSMNVVADTKSVSHDRSVHMSQPEHLYQLRVALSKPSPMLMWTPLPQHHGQIVQFK